MNDSERVELNELCSALVDGRLSEADNKRLQGLLRGSDEAKRFYVRSMQLSASLYSYASEMQSEAAEPSNIIRPSFWTRKAWPLAAAAAVLAVGLWIGHSLIPGSAAPDDDQEFIARISGSKSPTWGSPGGFQNGDELHRGQRLELTSGFAEITFDSGALLVVEGPASVDLDSAWQATLLRGTIKANIPQEAIGFKVSNASVDVVDLGTEFSMTADDDGSAEIFVLNGQVEVEPRVALNAAPRKILMKEKQSRRFALNGVSDVRDSEQKFVKLAKHVTFDLPKKAAGYAHWSFDASSDGRFPSQLLGAARGKNPVAIAVNDAVSGSGKFGEALEFSSTSGARFAASDLGFRSAKTVAFWVKIPEDANAADGSTFVGFGSAELGWNRSPADGAPGALRISNSRGHAVASTPLRDGRWHHVAAVISGQSAGQGKPSGKWHARLYVDGRLDAWSGKNPVRKGALAAVSPVDLLTLGSVGDERGFRGAIDELYIADRPLTPMEIRSLMRSNKPYLPENFAAN